MPHKHALCAQRRRILTALADAGKTKFALTADDQPEPINACVSRFACGDDPGQLQRKWASSRTKPSRRLGDAAEWVGIEAFLTRRSASISARRRPH